jgi:thiol-disulfide isomerase/thioredoxin
MTARLFVSVFLALGVAASAARVTGAPPAERLDVAAPPPVLTGVVADEGPEVGRVAPDIVGRDLDGVEFRLSDYRGKVVVLLFTADWCGICRSLYPYERFLGELYGNWPFAIVSVDGGPSADIARKAKASERLTYRSWLDAPTAGAPDGRIAAEWQVKGRPAVYVLDGDGVIRHENVRYEELLKAVRMLLTEHLERQERAGARSK